MERIDPDPLKKTLPQLFLSLGLVKTLLDQFGVELRFAQRGLSLLYFPKPGLKGARRGQRLPQFVAPDYVHKAETRKSILQKVEIACSGVAENTRSAQPDEEIVQVPAHQFKAEDFVRGRFRVDDAAHVAGVIAGRIESVILRRNGIRTLRGRTASARLPGAWRVNRPSANCFRNGDCADDVAATRMAQFVKQTPHREF